jgi:class 3 adenylate cyclase/Flp pilus assembly protein TadD
VSGEEHRLAAILFADIVGYSLMPEGVALQFRKKMLSLVHQNLSDYRGRLVKSQGDDILAEFTSATDAVLFAVALQDRISDQNASVGIGQRFRLRIGIHAGEVVVEGEDILGDAVNTAKRTESLAAPGGICLTESVWQQVLEQLPRPARRLGRIPAKNLKLPLVFWHLDPPGVGWAYRFAHRFRLGLGHPGRVAGMLVLGGLILWAAVLLVLLGGRLFPRNPSGLIERAQFFLERYDKEGYVQRAIDELDRVPRAAPQFAEAQAYLGLTYWRRYAETGELKTRTDALNASSNTIAANGEIPVAHFVQGLVAKDRGNWLAASNELVRANALEREENGLVLIELANFCLALHDASKASEYMQKAQEVQRKAWYFYNELAKYEFYRGNYEAAVTNSLQAIRLAPRNSIVECTLANIYLSLQDYTNHTKEAWACLEKSGKYRKTPVYYYTLGQYYLLESRWEEAFASYRKAAELKPKDYRLWGNAGLALKRKGKTLEAAYFLTRAIAKAQSILPDTEDCVVPAHVGLYQAALGHRTEALQRLQDALQRCPDNSVVRASAIQAREELGNGKEAEALQRLLDNL